MTEIQKEANTAKQAWKETYFLGRILPKMARMKVLKAGTNGMSQKISVILSFHQSYIFRFDGFFLSENEQNDGQTDGSLGCSYCDDKEDDDLSI